MNRLTFRTALALLAATVAAFVQAEPDLSGRANVTVYVAANGSDARTGSSPSEALQTLDRVQELLRARQFKDGERRIAVHFLPGTYRGMEVVWDFYSPGRSIVFEPEGYRAGTQSVTIDGAGSRASHFFLLRLTAESPDDSPISTNIALRGFRVTNYCEGMSLGDWKSKANVAGNLIEDNVFDRIGSKYQTPSPQPDGRLVPSGSCVAAVRLQRASNNVVRNNSFTDIENLPQKDTGVGKYGPRLLHAIYISQSSVGNLIEGNRFERFTGTPVQVRAQSDATRVVGNTFAEPVYPSRPPEQNKRIRAVAQWYCNDAVPACLRKAEDGNNECPSLGLEIIGNQVGRGLDVYADESQSKNATCTLPRARSGHDSSPRIERNTVMQ